MKELRSQRAADLNAVLVTLNDGGLCRQALLHWVSNGWIVIAPHSPLTALPGPSFDRHIGLREFCGAAEKDSGGKASETPDERGEEADEDS